MIFTWGDVALCSDGSGIHDNGVSRKLLRQDRGRMEDQTQTVQCFHMSLLFTFYWPKQVTQPCLTPRWKKNAISQPYPMPEWTGRSKTWVSRANVCLHRLMRLLIKSSLIRWHQSRHMKAMRKSALWTCEGKAFWVDETADYRLWLGYFGIARRLGWLSQHGR